MLYVCQNLDFSLGQTLQLRHMFEVLSLSLCFLFVDKIAIQLLISEFDFKRSVWQTCFSTWDICNAPSGRYTNEKEEHLIT